MADNILSDFPFLLICSLALGQIQVFSCQTNQNKKQVIPILLMGFLIYLAYGTRSIGIILLPIFILVDIISKKKVSVSTMAVTGVAIFLILMQSFLIPQTGSYFDQLPKTISGFVELFKSLSIYYFNVSTTLFPMQELAQQGALFGGMLVLSLLGFVTFPHKKDQIVYYLFSFCYLLALLMWPSIQGLRFLMPIIPLFLLYTFEGLQYFIYSVIKSQTLRVVGLVFLFGIFSFYSLDYYSRSVPRSADLDITNVTTKEIFNFVENKTQPNDVIAFFKPRALALFTNRKSLAIRPSTDFSESDIIKQFKAFDVRYFIISLNNDIKEWGEFDKTAPADFEFVFQNTNFKIFRVIYK